MVDHGLIDCEKKLPLLYYPQLIFQDPPTHVLRGYGDTLNMLGRHDEANEVFKRGVAWKYWRSHECRPINELPNHALARHPLFFLNKQELPLMTATILKGLPTFVKELHMNRDANWRLEAAGLHMDGTWYRYF